MCDTSYDLEVVLRGPNCHMRLIHKGIFRPVTPEVAGSSPVSRAIRINGLATLTNIPKRQDSPPESRIRALSIPGIQRDTRRVVTCPRDGRVWRGQPRRPLGRGDVICPTRTGCMPSMSEPMSAARHACTCATSGTQALSQHQRACVFGIGAPNIPAWPRAFTSPR